MGCMGHVARRERRNCLEVGGRVRLSDGNYRDCVFEAVGLTVSENKTEAMLLRTPDQTTLTQPLVIEAAGQRYKQTAQSYRNTYYMYLTL